MGNKHSQAAGELTTTVWNLTDSQVVLRHGEVSGIREILLNNKLQLSATKKIDNGSKHQIKHQDKTLHVTISAAWGGFKYKLTVDGKEQLCHLDVVSQVQDLYKFEVVDAKVVEEGVEKYVEYVLTVSNKKNTGQAGGEEVCRVHKRYSEFYELFQQLKSLYKKSPTLSKAVPSMPGKDMKLLKNHTDPAFVAKRKDGLNEFMSKVEQFPGMMENVPNFDDWLGLNNM
ncbi:hypothetical protein ScalyP_jg7473 [Parmales sp. scaly parma]|jgi:hypothetical protein|nr:hypothetical protein ScalyP_jg7473 [Parmales sp. scaly parma]